MPDMARYDPFSPTFDHPLLNSSPDYGSRNGSFRTRPIGEIAIVPPPMSFRERTKRLRSLEDEKNQLIEVRHSLVTCQFCLPLRMLMQTQDLLFQLETAQHQLDRLQLDHSREAQYNREGQLRETALHEQLVQVKTIMVCKVT